MTIGNWGFFYSDVEASEISSAARNLIEKCNDELLQERGLLTSRSVEKKEAEEKRLRILEFGGAFPPLLFFPQI